MCVSLVAHPSVGMYRIHESPTYHLRFGPPALTLTPEVQKCSLHLVFLTHDPSKYKAKDCSLLPLQASTHPTVITHFPTLRFEVRMDTDDTWLCHILQVY